MATARRLGVAFVLVLLAHGAAAGQLSVAPPPHPPLDEVVSEYQRLGLPLPPSDAELVRINWYDWVYYGSPNDEPTDTRYELAFRTRPTTSDRSPRYIEWGTSGSYLWERTFVEPASVEVAVPDPDVLRQVASFSETQSLCLAVTFRLRGWNDLAAIMYARAQEQLAENEVQQSVIVRLRHMAWRMSAGALTERGRDRKETLARLLRLSADEESLRTPEHLGLLRKIALTVTPPSETPLPGTAEAFIESLVEHYIDPDRRDSREGQEAYWNLVDMGFSAVPALIRHVDDERLTRGSAQFLGNMHWDLELRVGHLVGQILYRLSDGEIVAGGAPLRQEQMRLDPEKVWSWWNAARGVGEEKWLLAHAVPDPSRGRGNRPNEHILRVLAVKYPQQLAGLYRTVLRDRPRLWSGELSDAVAVSKLPREEKIDLFVEGVRHKDAGHRLCALNGLAGVDRVRFREELARLLRAGVSDPEEYLGLVENANDPECWDALTVLAGKCPLSRRLSLLSQLGANAPPHQPDPARRERLRFFLRLLYDRTAEPSDEEWMNMVEVRDYTAFELMGQLRFPVRRNSEYMVFGPLPTGPVTRYVLRGAVRLAAERELAQPRK